MQRTDNRAPSELRKVTFSPQFNRYAEGSVLVEFGHTKVACLASVETGLPKWLQGSDSGWVTAEYGMLPRSTHERMRREKTMTSGRTQEISRLIGRALRSCVDLQKLKDVQITVDCDVLQADGGTRTAAITGGFVAMTLAIDYLLKKNLLKENPIQHQVSAISVGLLENTALLDLNYVEDSNAETDCNFVINEHKALVEIQGTAEDTSFTRDQFNQMLDLALTGCGELHEQQRASLKQAGCSLLGDR